MSGLLIMECGLSGCSNDVRFTDAIACASRGFCPVYFCSDGCEFIHAREEHAEQLLAAHRGERS